MTKLNWSSARERRTDSPGSQDAAERALNRRASWQWRHGRLIATKPDRKSSPAHADAHAHNAHAREYREKDSSPRRQSLVSWDENSVNITTPAKLIPVLESCELAMWRDPVLCMVMAETWRDAARQHEAIAADLPVDHPSRTHHEAVAAQFRGRAFQLAH